MKQQFIENYNKEKVLPITSLSAVRDENNTPLSTILETMQENIQVVPELQEDVDKITKHKVYLTGSTLSQSMMPLETGQNTIYVVKDDLTLSEDVTVPANCVLEFDGGSINGRNIILSRDCQIVGGKLNLSGSMTLNYRSVITDCYITRTSQMEDNESFIIIDDQYFARVSSEIEIRLENVYISYLFGDGNNTHGNIVEIVSRGDYLYHGFYYVTFNNVRVESYAEKTFYIHNENGGWVTDVTFQRCHILMGKNGWVLESNNPNIALQKINILDCSMQAHVWSEAGLDCGFANRINVKNTEFWDWHIVETQGFTGRPLVFHQNTGDVYVDYVSAGDYKLVDSSDKHNNKIHIGDFYGSNRELQNFLDISQSVFLRDFLQVPDGSYLTPQNAIYNDILGVTTNQGGTMLFSTVGDSKCVIFISNNADSQKRKEVKFMYYASLPGRYKKVNGVEDPTQPILLSYESWTLVPAFESTSRTLKVWLKSEFKYVPFRTFDNASVTTFPPISNQNVGQIAIDDTYSIPGVQMSTSWKYLNTRPLLMAGPTSSRPSYTNITADRGQCFFDTSLSPARPIWWTGTEWVDATGQPV